MRNSLFYAKVRMFYFLYITPRCLQLKVEEKIKREYYIEENKAFSNEKKIVVCMFDGRVEHGGLSDRLMGIIATYELCCELGLEFRINFVFPFLLLDYLEPNIIDWRINPQDISYNSYDSKVVYVDTIKNSGSAGKKLQRKWLLNELVKEYKQIHVYTNACFSMKQSYSFLFHQLFKPTESLREELEYHSRKIGGNYVSISLRFLQLLGDFSEKNDFPILNVENRILLIKKCIDKIKEIKSKHPDLNVFCASDSITFLQEVNKLDYVYIIPGNVVHTDSFEVNNNSVMKTFVDFFMIARASKIYLLQTDKMYPSHFPYSASLINNISFEIINF